MKEKATFWVDGANSVSFLMGIGSAVAVNPYYCSIHSDSSTLSILTLSPGRISLHFGIVTSFCLFPLFIQTLPVNPIIFILILQHLFKDIECVEYDRVVYTTYVQTKIRKRLKSGNYYHPMYIVVVRQRRQRYLIYFVHGWYRVIFPKNF